MRVWCRHARPRAAASETRRDEIWDVRDVWQLWQKVSEELLSFTLFSSSCRVFLLFLHTLIFGVASTLPHCEALSSFTNSDMATRPAGGLSACTQPDNHSFKLLFSDECDPFPYFSAAHHLHPHHHRLLPGDSPECFHQPPAGFPPPPVTKLRGNPAPSNIFTGLCLKGKCTDFIHQSVGASLGRHYCEEKKELWSLLWLSRKLARSLILPENYKFNIFF